MSLAYSTSDDVRIQNNLSRRKRYSNVPYFHSNSFDFT